MSSKTLDQFSLIEEIVLPKFIIAHKTWFEQEGFSFERKSPAGVKNSRGYREDFEDKMTQMMWEEWQMSAFVVFSCMTAIVDTHIEIQKKR